MVTPMAIPTGRDENTGLKTPDSVRPCRLDGDVLDDATTS